MYIGLKWNNLFIYLFIYLFILIYLFYLFVCLSKFNSNIRYNKNVTGKTLTNGNLHTCYYKTKSENIYPSLCKAKDMECFGEDDTFKACESDDPKNESNHEFISKFDDDSNSCKDLKTFLVENEISTFDINKCVEDEKGKISELYDFISFFFFFFFYNFFFLFFFFFFFFI